MAIKIDGGAAVSGLPCNNTLLLIQNEKRQTELQYHTRLRTAPSLILSVIIRHLSLVSRACFGCGLEKKNPIPKLK